jgi:N-dimethylarginine dimethylaminohydrolase
MKLCHHSEFEKIQSILLKHPRDAFISQAEIDRQWQGLNYTSAPDLARAAAEYETFVSLLQDSTPELHFLPPEENTGLDSIYVRDCLLMTDRGAVLLNMGKRERSGEPQAAGETLSSLGIPVLGEITGVGCVEGGDVVMWDAQTLLVGQGYRTNAEGVHQLMLLVKDFIKTFIVIPLPHWQGPQDVLHLMSFISPLDRDLALVYSPLMPVFFREWLLAQGVELIEVPETEYAGMGGNVLAVAPRNCIMLEGNPQTRALLEKNDVKVRLYQGEEISRKGAGGPTCLTRPLLRQA